MPRRLVSPASAHHFPLFKRLSQFFLSFGQGDLVNFNAATFINTLPFRYLHLKGTWRILKLLRIQLIAT